MTLRDVTVCHIVTRYWHISYLRGDVMKKVVCYAV